MRNKYIGVIVILMSLLYPDLLQAQFSLSGEYRPRTELSHGYKKLVNSDQDAQMVTSQRTRLNLNYRNDYLLTKLVLQDVRLWGGQAQLVTNEDYAVSIHEAWAEIMLSDEFSLKAGRQEVAYDDHRIFGTVGWAQQARSHDMLLFKYSGDWDLHFGLAYHHDDNLNDDNPATATAHNDAYTSLQYVWFHNNWDASKLSLLLLNNGVPDAVDPANKVRYTQTIGGRYMVELTPITLASNLYFQNGKDASNMDVGAYNFLIEVSGSISDNMSFVGGFERLSGSDWDETDNKSFTPFYGTNHKFNGFMDYFYVGNHIGNVGLNDMYGKITVKNNDVTMGAHAHIFSSAAKIGPGVDNYLGTEIDLSLSYQFKPAVSFGFGWSTMLASDSMEVLKGGGDKGAFQHWGYAMIVVKPQFFPLK
ncbi:hypothetical protein [Plebeiibacterium marinum]|uniref:Alginate export domain-containing protein n=1 Tax=Plebeiibacterium marinum TaxID=2992111 RepID=A0AAE3MAC8_9BACT|nr:hypothetical protein [Plebeiobacterium marinum]MCW3804216.1 hypothetical protein [Plebeiobacterium marinum]